MTAPFDAGRTLGSRTGGLLASYRGELLRWNRQINLLSRRAPATTADALIRQCVRAFDLWWGGAGADLVGGGGALRLFDLGSGGGLPAFVWLALLAEEGVAISATLVEPREKRAWFLERLAGLPGAPTFTVVTARWGEAAGFLATGSTARTANGTPILLTLKALRLSEAAVLGGLGAAMAGLRPATGTAVELVRFQPAVGVASADLVRELEIPAAGAHFAAQAMEFAAVGCHLLVPPPGSLEAAREAGLLVTRHRVVGPEILSA